MEKNRTSGIGIFLFILLIIVIIGVILLLVWNTKKSPFVYFQQNTTEKYLVMATGVAVTSVPTNNTQWSIFKPDPTKEAYAILNLSKLPNGNYLGYTTAVDGTELKPLTTYTEDTAGWVFSGISGTLIQPSGATTLSLFPTATSVILKTSADVTDGSNLFSINPT